MITKLNARKAKNLKNIGLITLAFSTTVILLWILGLNSISGLILGGPPMDLITAFSFFLLSLGILASQRRSFFFIFLNRAAIIGVLIISLITILDVFLANSAISLGYFVKVSGSMTVATALSFLLMGGSVWAIYSKSERVKLITQFILFAILLLNTASAIIFVLNIPGDSASFLIPIPFFTSLLFFWLSAILSHKNAPQEFNDLLFGNYAGSKLLKVVAPYNFFMIVVMTFTLLYLINNNVVGLNSGVIIYAVIAVFVSVSYVFVVGIQFNKKEQEKEKFERAFHASTKEIQQYKEALDSSFLVDITDVNGKIISVNDKFCEVSKYDRNELIGKKHSVNKSGYHPEDFFKELWATIKSGEIWLGGIKNKTKDGKFYWAHTAIVPFKNERNEIYQFLTIRQDITQHTQMAVQFESLKQRNKELEQFTYIASHDLQEPLRTVRSIIDILNDEYSCKLDEDARLSLEFMIEATDRMSELIKGLLDYSRIGRTKKIKIVDSNEIIQEIIIDLTTVIKGEKAVVTSDKLPLLKAYKIELRLLFQNLISNAIKFQKPGTCPKVHVSVQDSLDYWRFSVKDNGIGIPEKNKQDVFAIFKRLNKRSNYEGTGIGLAHCEKIVHMHGGEIWVDSIENEGSTFYFTILKNLI